MMTIKFALIAMMISSSALPVNMEKVNNAIIYPRPQIEVVNQKAAPEIQTEETRKDSINKDKTYEECKKEAFERVYEEVNRMLDQIPDQCEEQFQLQRMM